VNGFELQLSLFQFAMLVVSTMLIGAAGNIINDYFDQEIDSVNRSSKRIVGVHISEKATMTIYQVVNVLGLALIFYLAYSLGKWKLSIVSFFAATSLWFYSVQFKKDLIIGNVLIAFLTGLVPLLVGIYEVPLLIDTYGQEVVEFFKVQKPGEDPSLYFKWMFYFLAGYAGFAFLLNLVREIQKDMADIKGDSKQGARTLPIAIGINNAKWVVSGLILTTIVLIFAVQQEVVSDSYSLAYLIIAVLIPLVGSVWLNHKSVERQGFLKASNLTKLAMFGGLMYSIAHYFIYYAGDLS
ncbi:MAG: geranylgeranylglycerol-phosphate geranylgeranyltransferase, partial [Bacteroidota bacterium]